MRSNDPAPEPARTSRPGRWVALCVVAVVVAAVLVVGLTRGGDDLLNDGPKLDGTAAAPAITGADLQTGETVDLTSFRGKPVFVNVWASWCNPCREEAPEILRFTREHPEVAFVGINFNEQKKADGLAFNEKAGWTHPSIADPDGAITIDKLGISVLPVTLYIDANGVLRGRSLGQISFGDLTAVAERIAK